MLGLGFTHSLTHSLTHTHTHIYTHTIDATTMLLQAQIKQLHFNLESRWELDMPDREVEVMLFI